MAVALGLLGWLASGAGAAVKTLTADERLEGFVQLWSAVKSDFVFLDQRPGLDWDKVLREYLPRVRAEQSDEAYARLLSECVARLQDGHSVVWGEGAWFAVPLYPRNAPPVAISPVEGKAIIADLVETEDVRRAGLTRGMEVTAIDGRPVREVLEHDLYPYLFASTQQGREAWAYPVLLEGAPGTTVSLGIRDLRGGTRTVTLTRVHLEDGTIAALFPKPWWAPLVTMLRGTPVPWDRRPTREARDLPGGLLYVPIDSFMTDGPVKQFEALSPRLAQAKGLLIDVRENSGGSSGNAYGVVSYLTDRPLKTSHWKTRLHRPSVAMWSGKDEWSEGDQDAVQPVAGKRPFLGPVVVLIGPRTISAAEDFLVPLQSGHRATLVGQATNGSTGQPRTLQLPGGISATVCTKWDTFPDGREFVGVGVLPDVPVYPTQAEVAAGKWSGGKDPVLEKGLEVLRKAVASSSQGRG